MNLQDIFNSPAYQKVSGWMPNKYLVVLVAYISYMIFFDSNDFRSQAKLWSEVHTLKKEKALLQESLKEVIREREQLFTDKKSLEKFARERYLMKRENETVFVIVEEEVK